ncbi:MAG: CoB--CoM heterodisulfide reductase iron-sulfur subunit B family protein [Candidatus Methanomethylicia archaeon]|nr:CoB--CoM heterodisulfide reductase iron-sulfur subunit B family protein [Candidatus Methanomethylicia archaeon]
MPEYSLFLGCYIPAMQPFAEASMRKISQKLGLKLIDIIGASCCPVPEIARLVDEELWLTIASRNIALAEKIGRDIIVLCNGCWETLHEANENLKHSEELMDKININLNSFRLQFNGNIKVKHYVEVLFEDIGLDVIEKNVKVDLSKFKFALHPGCKLYKMTNEKGAKYFREIVKVLNIELIDYGLERVCCGYPLMLYSVDKAMRERTKWKLDVIKSFGADAIIVACPACYDQFEKTQLTFRDEGIEYGIPVLHLSELIALSFNIPPKEVGLDSHGVSTEKIIVGVKG